MKSTVLLHWMYTNSVNIMVLYTAPLVGNYMLLSSGRATKRIIFEQLKFTVCDVLWDQPITVNPCRSVIKWNVKELTFSVHPAISRIEDRRCSRPIRHRRPRMAMATPLLLCSSILEFSCSSNIVHPAIKVFRIKVC